MEDIPLFLVDLRIFVKINLARIMYFPNFPKCISLVLALQQSDYGKFCMAEVQNLVSIASHIFDKKK